MTPEQAFLEYAALEMKKQDDYHVARNAYLAAFTAGWTQGREAAAQVCDARSVGDPCNLATALEGQNTGDIVTAAACEEAHECAATIRRLEGPG